MPEQQKPQPNIKEILADYPQAVKFFSQTPAEVWERISQQMAIKTFKETASSIPAYREFLKLKKINPDQVITTEDFLNLPILDKYNYIQVYGFNEVNSSKAGSNLYGFSLSSGTVDQPTIWPRYIQYEDFLPGVFDLFMRLYWQIDKKSTLLINAFAMGPWIAGFTVHQAVRPLTQRHNLTLATTGADIESIVYSIVKLAKYYDQVVIYSYPTFARTILDRLELAGVNLRKLRLKMFIAGEGHTVEWRQYINKLISGDSENITDIIDGYGITDVGLAGMGSAMTNLIRDLAHKNIKFRESLFGRKDIVPTLFQYNPGTYYVEAINGETVFTTTSTTPLVRYNVHDRGGTISFRNMEKVLTEHGYDYKEILKKKKINPDIVWQQPFVYCFGRRDDTVCVGGANIFPEQISPVLFSNIVNDIHSFKIAIDHDAKQRSLLYVILELKSGIKYTSQKIRTKKKKYHDIIVKQLKSANLDFADAYRIDPRSCDPKIEIFSAGTGPFADDVRKTKPRLIIRKK